MYLTFSMPNEETPAYQEGYFPVFSQVQIFIESLGKGSLAAFPFLTSPPAPSMKQPFLLLLPLLCPYKYYHCVLSMCSAENGCVLYTHQAAHMSYYLTNTSRPTSLTERRILVLSSVCISSRSYSQTALFYLLVPVIHHPPAPAL